ncbi:MAG: prephenate dehydrogenase/arogenate dehydrogenase family protein [Deinococcota bacterium]
MVDVAQIHLGTRPEPFFDTVVIAGVGLIGGSIGLGMRQRFLAKTIIGLDNDPTVLEAATGLGILDEEYLQAGDWLQRADLVILASPARTIIDSAKEIEPFLRPDTIVTDVGSVKGDIVKALSHLNFVGSHPMAGSERGGVVNADAGLLENAVWILTPDVDTNFGALKRVRNFVEELGARTIEVDPIQHDYLVAVVSHVPYLAAVALTNAVAHDRNRNLMMLLAAGGFRDLTRVASGSPRMSRDMVVSNKDALREALASFREQLDTLESLLDEPEDMLEHAQRAKRSRDSFPIVKRSLLPARYELFIAVPDKTGELAVITGSLSDAQVSIKDIEVVGIREAGASIRLAFESEQALETAKQVLTERGYDARGRGQ